MVQAVARLGKQTSSLSACLNHQPVVMLSWCLYWQVTTDIPAHHFMKSRSGVEGARDIDGTTRGLGATAAVPTTSCGEENLTMVDDRSVASCYQPQPTPTSYDSLPNTYSQSSISRDAQLPAHLLAASTLSVVHIMQPGVLSNNTFVWLSHWLPTWLTDESPELSRQLLILMSWIGITQRSGRCCCCCCCQEVLQ